MTSLLVQYVDLVGLLFLVELKARLAIIALFPFGSLEYVLWGKGL
jgi:hypothetical protein